MNNLSYTYAPKILSSYLAMIGALKERIQVAHGESLRMSVWLTMPTEFSIKEEDALMSLASDTLPDGTLDEPIYPEIREDILARVDLAETKACEINEVKR